jgi:hypothetical protein
MAATLAGEVEIGVSKWIVCSKEGTTGSWRTDNSWETGSSSAMIDFLADFFGGMKGNAGKEVSTLLGCREDVCVGNCGRFALAKQTMSASSPRSPSKRWVTTTASALEDVASKVDRFDRSQMVNDLRNRKLHNTKTSILFGNDKVMSSLLSICSDHPLSDGLHKRCSFPTSQCDEWL